MKKLILVIFMAGSFFVSKAQTEPLATPFAVPVDSITNLITYEKVVEVKGVAAADLYKRILDWFNSYYTNPTEVIRENDSVKFVIVGKPRFRLSKTSAKDGSKSDGGNMQYTITVSARDGRFKYELTAFNWKQLSYYPVEKWLDTKSASYEPIYNDYLQQTDKTALDAVKSLVNAATHEKPVKNKDSW